MENSILISIKRLLGIPEEYKTFDVDIMIHINTILSNLVQMGVGPAEGFTITDKNNVWEEFTSNNKLIEQVKTYVYIKVKLLFDPPTNSNSFNAFESQAKELEYRLYTQTGGY